MASNGSASEFEDHMSTTTVGQTIRLVIQTARLSYLKVFYVIFCCLCGCPNDWFSYQIIS